jgi:DNA gyrase subunit A
MPKEKDTTTQTTGTDKIKPSNIVSEMKDSYLAYAMSVITSRALPDVRDGLKPVHRRILYAMHELGITHSAKFRKSALVVGEVLGKFHPHGDSSVYDAMVNMAQTFSYRYPLVLGQGNFGSIDGDSAAAMRYTEAKMSKISGDLLADIDKNTVDFRPNYDDTRKEPVVLPAAVPSLLLNGTLGIAVGMATNIPPHNLREVVDATLHLIDNPKATTEDLVEFIEAPDFPTGGIVYNKKDILAAYSTGRGGVVTRGEAEIVETKVGMSQIVVKSLPYQVLRSSFVEQVAELFREKKLVGLKDLRDESTDEMRVVIDLKNTAHPQKVLNYLYKHTQLEQNFNFNMVALVDGVPRTLSLKDFLVEFIAHREVVVKRRAQFDLDKALAREHILLGLKMALDHIDEIIKVIRSSKDVGEAKANLMKKWKFSDLQATAILEMRLQKLAGLERKAVEMELKEKQELIAYLRDLLGSPKKILKVIAGELKDIRDKHGDDRRTKIVKGGVREISEEDLIPEADSVLVFTAGGYVKRTDPNEYKTQKRGGVGVVDLETKEEDVVTHLLKTSTHSDLLFFTNFGKAYQLKMYEIPEGRRATKGKSIMNFLQLSAEEKVTSIVALSKDAKAMSPYLLLVTNKGVTKKMSSASFQDVRRSGLIAIRLDAGDELHSANFLDKSDEIILATKMGQSIRFKEADVREMGRGAGGVRGIKLVKASDNVVGASIIKKSDKDATFLVISENGLGKRSEIDEYKVQGRGGSGVKTFKITPKTGNVVAAGVVTDVQSELIAMSKKGQVIRVEIDAVPVQSRSTQGVKIMRPREGDSVASVTFL